MQIKEFTKALEKCGILTGVSNSMDISIDNVTYNSKTADENSLFVCKGINFKREYLDMAVENGIKCYVSTADFNIENVMCITVSDERRALSKIADVFYSSPSKKLTVCGITGTKGKTTTSYMIHSILKQNDGAAGLMSSKSVCTGDKEYESHITTPESLELQGYLYEMVNNGVKKVSLEVSSQAVKMQRVADVKFDMCIFLNISTDHISPSEHIDFADYFGSKIKLFSMCKTGIINGDDGLLYDMLPSLKCNVTTFGFDKKNDVVAGNIEKTKTGISFDVSGKLISDKFEINMAGVFNVYNALAAITACALMGIDKEIIKKGLKNAYIDGRMQIVEKDGVTVIIDYAHNKLSFETLVQSVNQEYNNPRIIAVFGCPGGKALNRRKDLGEIAAKYCDLSVVTQDDSNYENVKDICNEICLHIDENKGQYKIIADRKGAVEYALSVANKGDVVLVIGKGAEQTMLVEGKNIPYEGDYDIILQLVK